MANEHRVLLCVECVSGDTLIASIPQWSNERTVRVALAALPDAIREILRPDLWLLATANLGATDATALDLQNFELAPDPDPNDGLA